MAEKTGVKIDTLQYYEREGLIITVDRYSNGQSWYSAGDTVHIEVLCCLCETGMGIVQLRRYCELGEQGDRTRTEQMQLLEQHKQTVLDKIRKMEESLALIEAVAWFQ